MAAIITMKAALLTTYGARLSIREVPRPAPRADEVLVEIEASGVCYTDVHIWKGEHAAPNPLPLIMRHEGVGRVVEVGAQGGPLKVGDRVGIGYVYGACGHCKECQTEGENYYAPSMPRATASAALCRICLLATGLGQQDRSQRGSTWLKLRN